MNTVSGTRTEVMLLRTSVAASLISRCLLEAFCDCSIGVRVLSA